MLSILGQNTAISTLILNTMWYVIPCSWLGRQNKDVSEKTPSLVYTFTITRCQLRTP